jgi:hypothetical protein
MYGYKHCSICNVVKHKHRFKETEEFLKKFYNFFNQNFCANCTTKLFCAWVEENLKHKDCLWCKRQFYDDNNKEIKDFFHKNYYHNLNPLIMKSGEYESVFYGNELYRFSYFADNRFCDRCNVGNCKQIFASRITCFIKNILIKLRYRKLGISTQYFRYVTFKYIKKQLPLCISTTYGGYRKY